jgi:hypothetical protein
VVEMTLAPQLGQWAGLDALAEGMIVDVHHTHRKASKTGGIRKSNAL